MNNKKSFLFIIFLFCTALIFISCSFSSKESIFTIANGKSPITLNPLDITDASGERIYTALFAGLTSIDAKTGLAMPAIAESFEIANDARSITFVLQKSSWSDGKAITAQTFADSWLYALSQDVPSKYQYLLTELIEGASAYAKKLTDKEGVGIDVIDDATLRVRFVKPCANAATLFAHSAFAPLPLHVIQKEGDKWTSAEKFVCNGAYKILNAIENNTLTLVPNKRYYNKDKVAINTLRIVCGNIDKNTIDDFKNGKIDFIAELPLELSNTVQNDAHFFKFSSLKTEYLLLNNNHKVLNDVLIRKAIASAIDTSAIINDVFGAKAGTASTQNLVPQMRAFKSANNATTFDVEHAKRLLTQAGYKDSKGLPTFTLAYNADNPVHARVIEHVANQLQKNLNLSVRTESYAWDEFLDKRYKNNFDIARSGWEYPLEIAYSYLEQFIASDANNDACFNQSSYDALMRKASSALNLDEQNDLLARAENMLINEYQTIVPLYTNEHLALFNTDKWSGFVPNARNVYYYTDFAQITVDSK